MSLLNDKYIFRDTNAGNGVGNINLITQMVPANIAAPTSFSIVGGNEDGQWLISSNSVTPAGSSVIPKTYTLTIRATWATFPSPFNVQDATLTIVVPAQTRYVDPATGNDNAAGTKAAPWAHAPGDSQVVASSVAATFSPNIQTLVVIKGGSFIRGGLVQASTNIVYCGGEEVGWGTGATTYCGSDPLGAHSTPSNGDVFNNPNVANIKKWTPTFPSGKRELAQYLVDRDDQSLVMWAQWPRAGADPYLDAADPHRANPSSYFAGDPLKVSTSGYYSYARANIIWGTKPNKDTGLGGTDTTIIWPPELKTLMAGNSLVGYFVGIWVVANEVAYFEILTDDTNQGTIRPWTVTNSGGTITVSGYDQQANDPTVIQVIGHPLFIRGAGQFAWSPNQATIYAWTVSASNIEMMTRKRGLNGDATAYVGVQGMTFEAYYGHESLSDGNGIGLNSSPNKTFKIINNNCRWIVCGNAKGGGVRTAGSGDNIGCITDGNRVTDGVRSSGLRFSSDNISCIVRNNYVNRVGRTGVYFFAPQHSICENNYIARIVSAHGNGYTFYNDRATADDFTFRYNVAENAARPLTKDPIPNSQYYGNVIEMDESQKASTNIYGSLSSETWDRSAFMRRRGVTGDGENAYGGPGNVSRTTYWMASWNNIPFIVANASEGIAAETVTWAGGSGTVSQWVPVRTMLTINGASLNIPPGTIVTGQTSGAQATIIGSTAEGTLTNCVFDGLTGIEWSQTFTNCLVTYVATNEMPIYQNTDGNTLNKLAADQTVWDGTFKPEMKQFLGAGRIGDQFLSGIAVANWPNIINAKVSTGTYSAWSLVTTDGTKTLTMTNGQAQVSTDGTENTAGALASSVAVSDGQYVRLFTTSDSANSTTKTVTADFGEGNVYTWTVKTERASGWPILNTAGNDLWRPSGTVALGSRTTTQATIFIPLGAFADPTVSTVFFGPTSGNIPCSVTMLSTKVLRVLLRDVTNAITVVRIDTPPIDNANPVDVLITIDSTLAASGATSVSNPHQSTDAIRVYFDGVQKTVTTAPTLWTQNAQIGWTGTSASYRFGGGSIPNLLAGIFVWDVVAPVDSIPKFTPLYMGKNGFTNPLSTAPLVALVGNEAAWEAGGGINLGTGPKFIPQGADVQIASGASTTWPSYTYATATTISGPTSVTAGVTSSYTVIFNGSLNDTQTVTLSDGGAGGTFSRTSIEFPGAVDSVPASFTYTPSSSGSRTLTAASSGLTSGTLTLLADVGAATAYSVSMPTTATVGTPFTITLTLNGPAPFDMNLFVGVSGGTATISQTTIPLLIDEVTASVSVTPTSSGTLTFAFGNDGSLTDAAPVAVTVANAPATAISVTGPAAAQIGVAATYTVSVNGALSSGKTIALSSGGAGGVFNPTSLTFNAGAAPASQTFTFTPANSGATTLTASTAGLTSGTVVVAVSTATAVVLTGPTLVYIGNPATYTVDFNGYLSSNTTVNLSGAGGLLSNTSLIFPASSNPTPKTFTFTPSVQGATVLTANAVGLTAATANVAVNLANAITLTGSPTGSVGTPTVLTVGFNGYLAANTTVNLSSNANGTANATTLAFTASSNPLPKAFTYTANTAGSHTLTANATSYANATTTISMALAGSSTYSILAPASANTLHAFGVTFALNGVNITGYTLTLNVTGASSRVSATTLVIPPGETSGTVTILPLAAGTISISAVGSGGLSNPSAATVTITNNFTTISPGQTVVMTKEQAERLRIVTAGQTLSATAKPITLRWGNGRGGVDLKTIVDDDPD